ncbi:MAG TPA: sigma-70 family RNA polymerase sigma factor [Intrasporangium sp.]|nr:sigma-70 family RNA polymerase sigma factor [Intrasporangium sp.]
MSVDVTLWSSVAWSSAADLQLLAEARSGSAEAYGELWRRHLPAAYAVASRYRGRSSPEDIVAEASARVLSLIQDGKGPEEHFRSYFLSAVRTVAVDNARRDLRVVPAESDDLEALTDPVVEDFPGDGIDADLVREAFAGLSERDRRVLWHTTVEGEAPRTLAPVLGMTANAVSASAMRARDALRAHYLDAHASRRARSADSDECRWTIDHLGAHVRGRLPKRQAERVRRHLEQCPHAATVAAELTEINSEFPALLVPLILLAGLSTPGFVSAGALAGLTAGLLGGSAQPAGHLVPSPVGPLNAAGAASSAGGSSGAVTSAAGSTASEVAIVGQQVAGVASSVAAAIAIAAGVVAASPSGLPAPSAVAPAVATPTPGRGGLGPVATPGGGPTGFAPGASGGAAATGQSRGGATGAGPGGGASSLPGSLSGGGAPAAPATPGAGAAAGGGLIGGPAGGARVVDAVAAPVATAIASPTTPPATPASTGGSSSTPRPSSSPTPSPSGTPSPTSTPPPSPTSQPPPQGPTVRGLVSASGEAWVQVPGASLGLGVILTNRFGGGTLTADNQAWACLGSGTTTLRCTVKSDGRFRLTQRGLPGAQPIVVAFPATPGLTVVLPVGR